MLLAFVVAPWTSAFAAERVALVIGNGAYEHAPRLGNATNDAKDIRDALVKLGFKVEQTLLDKPKEELIRGLREFRTAAEAAQIAVVFYAGHGIEVAGVNYLVPVDAELRSDGHVEYEAVSLELVTNAAAGARSFGLVVLDACRDNPFARKMRRAGATRSIGRGLGRVEPTGGGMMVAYAAKAGTTADDGDGRNSPYTAALLRHLEDGDLVGEILNKVSQSVQVATGGAQVPVAYGHLPPEAYFAPVEGGTPVAVPAPYVQHRRQRIRDTEPTLGQSIEYLNGKFDCESDWLQIPAKQAASCSVFKKSRAHLALSDNDRAIKIVVDTHQKHGCMDHHSIKSSEVRMRTTVVARLSSLSTGVRSISIRDYGGVYDQQRHAQYDEGMLVQLTCRAGDCMDLSDRGTNKHISRRGAFFETFDIHTDRRVRTFTLKPCRDEDKVVEALSHAIRLSGGKADLF